MKSMVGFCKARKHFFRSGLILCSEKILNESEYHKYLSLES